MKQAERGAQDCYSDTTSTHNLQAVWLGENRRVQHLTYQFTGDKTAKRQILHFLDMTVLNSFHLWKVCGTKVTHRDIQLSLL